MDTNYMDTILKVYNGIWQQFNMGHVYMSWRENGHDSKLSMMKAIDSLPYSIKDGFRDMDKIIHPENYK